MSFSKRYGYEPPKPLQFESMDDDLKMAIHNVIVDLSNQMEYILMIPYILVFGVIFIYKMQMIIIMDIILSKT